MQLAVKKNTPQKNPRTRCEFADIQCFLCFFPKDGKANPASNRMGVEHRLQWTTAGSPIESGQRCEAHGAGSDARYKNVQGGLQGRFTLMLQATL